jgi:hypothetical protein
MYSFDLAFENDFKDREEVERMLFQYASCRLYFVDSSIIHNVTYICYGCDINYEDFLNLIEEVREYKSIFFIYVGKNDENDVFQHIYYHPSWVGKLTDEAKQTYESTIPTLVGESRNIYDLLSVIYI